uniref:Uncharacterized protein n=1 Tax=Anguilla anguilla TaxID=7936 RepID=A0A0E9XV25_ANGAN
MLALRKMASPRS